jgi:hypothetical protein
MRKIFLLIIGLIFLLGTATPARAQSSAQATLYNLQTASFPAISAGMDVYDAAGSFVTGLQAGDITIIEDNQPRAISKLEELQPGTQFAVALNTGAIFGWRDEYAVTRLDTIRSALMAWAMSLPSDKGDDLNLVAVGATETAHVNVVDFLTAITAYTPDAKTLLPTLDTFSRAIDLAAASDPASGRKRAVLFITAILEPETFSTLQSLTARAQQSGVRVYVWIVANQEQFGIAGATALKDVAIQTGGQYMLFSGVEALPSPETYLAPMRHTYTLAYTSAISASGTHTITVAVNVAGTTVTASPLSYDINVQPPNPIPVSPPEQIVRTAPDDKTTNLLAFIPATQTIEMMVEFPDGHPRPLLRTALYVDGQKVAENISAPFERFTWDVSGYQTSGEHLLQVEVVDSLGLRTVSIGVPVTITIVQPPQGLTVVLAHNAPWIAGGAVLLAGGVLAIVLTAGLRKKKPKRRTGPRSHVDPLTQPVETVREHRSRSSRSQKNKMSPAYLIRLRSDGQVTTIPAISLTGEEVTFGNDPTKATFVIDDPAVSALHARIAQGADDNFVLTDEKSAAGTWVNFEQITEPYTLKHGDILHIGRMSYRFMLRTPPEKTGPHLTPYKS